MAFTLLSVLRAASFMCKEMIIHTNVALTLGEDMDWKLTLNFLHKFIEVYTTRI